MSTPFLGEIRLLPYTFAPVDWVDCDGRVLEISQNEALFSLLGTIYGGDGQRTFGVPDLRGRVPLHQGHGAGLATRNIGELGGAESVTLTTAQLPAHLHGFNATSVTASAAVPAPNNQFGSSAKTALYTSNTQSATGIPVTSGMLAGSGGSQPHENLMPTLTVRFCIATAGIYPTRS